VDEPSPRTSGGSSPSPRLTDSFDQKISSVISVHVVTWRTASQQQPAATTTTTATSAGARRDEVAAAGGVGELGLASSKVTAEQPMPVPCEASLRRS
jgi:hypothetical protein